MRFLLGVASLALLLALAAVHARAASVRGVDPALASRYQPVAGKFTCLDGSKAIPASQVNDGYCDCVDGTDEPGTPACPNGSFYCNNLLFQPLRLNSSFVDDGVCDCCDGTDEPAGKCANTCKEKGTEALSGLKTQLADAQAGLAERRKYIKAAAAARAQWAARLAEISGVEAAAEQREQRATARRDELETQEKALEAKKSRIRVEPAVPAPEEGAAEPAAEDTTAPGGDEEGQEPEEGEASAAEGLAEDVEAESAEALAARVASQWIPGNKGGSGEEGEQAAAGQEAEEEDEGVPPAEEEGAEEAAEPQESFEDSDVAGLGVVDRLAGWAAALWAQLSGKGHKAAALSRIEAELAAVQRKLSAARDEATAAAAAREALSDEKKALEAKQGHDYGPDGAYAALVERCVDALVDKYTYRVCPFQHAEQLDGNHPTSLGSWDGFEEGHAGLRFKNGEHCWQGPNRSINVALRCGRAEALARVAEPSRCEYSAEMTTPAACSEGEVAALEAELKARTEALQQGGKDEL